MVTQVWEVKCGAEWRGDWRVPAPVLEGLGLKEWIQAAVAAAVASWITE